MTLKELSQLYYLKREIEMDQRRLRELEAKAMPGAQVITGMPHGSNVADIVGRYAAEIADLRGIIDAKQQQCIHERNRLEKYIFNIEDSLTRQIFQFRFIDGLSYDEIADKLDGGNTFESVRKRVYRYLHRK